jgi:hypothetical protein
VRVVIPRDAGDHGYLALEVDGVGSFRRFGGVRRFGGFRRFGSFRCRGSRVGGGARDDGELLGLLGGRLVFGLVLLFGGRLLGLGLGLGGRLVVGDRLGGDRLGGGWLGGGWCRRGGGRRGGRRGRCGNSADTGHHLGGGSVWRPVPRAQAGCWGRRWRGSRRAGDERGGAARNVRGALGGQVTRARRGGLHGGRGPRRGGGDRRPPGRTLGDGLSGRDVHGRRLRPSQLRLGRRGRGEQLFPLDQRANGQGQQGYAAHADRDVDQGQLAGDDPGNQQSDRDGNEKRAEPDHGRSLSDPFRSSAPTGGRARALPRGYGSHRNGARPQRACRTVRNPGRRYARPPARSARPASVAGSPPRRWGIHRFR